MTTNPIAEVTGDPVVNNDPTTLTAEANVVKPEEFRNTSLEQQYSEEDLETARDIVRRSGAPDSAISKLPHEALIDWALQLEGSEDAPEEEADDPYSRILARLGVTDEPTPAPQPKPSEEPAPRLGTGLSGEAAWVAQMQQQASTIESLAALVEGMVLKDAKTRLSEPYPEVKDGRKFDAVVRTANRLLSTGGYSDLDQAIDDAALLAFRRPASSNRGGRSLAHLRKGGTPSTTDRETAPPQNNAELVDKLALLVAQGRVDEAKRLAGR